MKKNNNKGFTLVELIVVLVILAILAAILVPALLGYIDKAREKQITTNAEAALVASQAIMNEEYGLLHTASAAKTKATSWAEVNKLADITPKGSTNPTLAITATGSGGNSKHAGFVITGYSYTENGSVASWSASTGEWSVTTP